MARPSANQAMVDMLSEFTVAIRMQDPLCYYTAEEVASWFLKTNSRKLIDYAREFDLIKFKKIGQEYRYNRASVEEFLKIVGDDELKNREDVKRIAQKRHLLQQVSVD